MEEAITLKMTVGQGVPSEMIALYSLYPVFILFVSFQNLIFYCKSILSYLVDFVKLFLYQFPMSFLTNLLYKGQL